MSDAALRDGNGATSVDGLALDHAQGVGQRKAVGRFVEEPASSEAFLLADGVVGVVPFVLGAGIEPADDDVFMA